LQLGGTSEGLAIPMSLDLIEHPQPRFGRPREVVGAKKPKTPIAVEIGELVDSTMNLG